MAEYHSDESGMHPKRLPAFPRQGWRAFRSEDEMRDLFKEYFQYCKDNDEPPTRVGLSLWLGMVKSTFQKYVRGEYDDDLNKFSEACNEAIEFVENNKLVGGLKGKYNPQIAKFDLENNHGYKERKAIEGGGEGAPPIKTQEAGKIDPTTLTPDAAHRLWQDVQRRATAEGEPGA